VIKRKTKDSFYEYKLKYVLAEGGQGVVYMAEHEPTGLNMAVKMIKEEGSYEQKIEFLKQEIGILLRAPHPNILNVD